MKSKGYRLPDIITNYELRIANEEPILIRQEFGINYELRIMNYELKRRAERMIFYLSALLFALTHNS